MEEEKWGKIPESLISEMNGIWGMRLDANTCNPFALHMFVEADPGTCMWPPRGSKLVVLTTGIDWSICTSLAGAIWRIYPVQ